MDICGKYGFQGLCYKAMMRDLWQLPKFETSCPSAAEFHSQQRTALFTAGAGIDLLLCLALTISTKITADSQLGLGASRVHTGHL